MASRTVSKVYVASKISQLLDVASTLLKNSVDVSSCKCDQKTVALEELELIDASISKEQLHQIPEIEFLFADPSIIGQILSHANNKLKWAQCTYAGLEPIIQAIRKYETMPDVLISRHTDGLGQSMAEYVIGQIISRERSFPSMIKLQEKSSFDFSQLSIYRNLDAVSIGILGLGTIGCKVAHMCKSLGMTVWATVRDERYNSGGAVNENVHAFRPLSRINEMLENVDYFVNILPSAPQTRGLLSGDVLKACEKKKTVFINIGRGNIIDDESLICALEEGWLGGAILDVFNTEPLPPSSPLWKLPGVVITPHISGCTDPNKGPSMC
ncbi:glyoxylate/hydroxypyruvate reductase A-like isoform X2 [Physella acuta]|uniref:glyoxylate/hydroxypyruvate reductase A-like isoform X2 n=1 Tax=Physella acuta TaxID=109671 RepID=UPI0027DB69F7|nr:glyoxylate/hydroxypyruvate reductase A-like isoform X2 [Physella acuta]